MSAADLVGIAGRRTAAASSAALVVFVLLLMTVAMAAMAMAAMTPSMTPSIKATEPCGCTMRGMRTTAVRFVLLVFLLLLVLVSEHVRSNSTGYRATKCTQGTTAELIA